jgi:hypothetical protein
MVVDRNGTGDRKSNTLLSGGDWEIYRLKQGHFCPSRFQHTVTQLSASSLHAIQEWVMKIGVNRIEEMRQLRVFVPMQPSWAAELTGAARRLFLPNHPLTAAIGGEILVE